MNNLFAQASQQVLSWIYPPRCLGCEVWVEKQYALCAACEQTLHWLPAELSVSRISQPYWNKVYSSLAYEGNVSKALLRYKYSEDLSCLPLFAEWLAFHQARLAHIDVIVPVPLGKKKLASRGFQQTLLLAKALGKKIDKPVLRHALRRVQEASRAQMELNAAERQVSVHGHFALDEKQKNQVLEKNVLLLDDVFTTGATSNECAKVLKQAGAREVVVLTVARRL